MTDLRIESHDESYPPSLYAPPIVPATGATAGIPGSWTPSGSTAPASVADLIAGIPNAVTASPATLWTVGQYVQTQTVGTTGRAYWNGTAWVAGASPVAEEPASEPQSFGEPVPVEELPPEEPTV